MPDPISTSKAAKFLGSLLGACALYSLIALGSTGFGAVAPRLFSGPGGALVGAFSWASLFIPAWFAAASLLAFLPGWRPAAVAALAGSILCFVPVALFARISSDPAAFMAEIPFLEAAGLPALGAGCAAIALLFAALVARVALSLSRSRRIVAESGARAGLLPPPRLMRPEGDEVAAPEREPSAAGRFDFEVPLLAPLPPLRSLGESGEGAADRATDSGAEPAVPPTAPETAARVPELDGGAETDDVSSPLPVEKKTSPEAESISHNVESDRPSDGGASIVELAGARPIEFTSVPPHPASASAEDGAKEAALGRILARRAAERKDKPYSVPVEGILTSYPDGEYWIIDEKTRHSAELLRETLAEFNIEAEVTGIRKGPVITMFEILPAHGVRLSKIANLADNIALRLAASSVRIVAPIPGKHAVGIEVPNDRRSIVSLREIVENESFKTAKMAVPVILGKDIAGEVQFIDLTQTPHLLIAGATGSGKSVCVNSIILSILFRRSPQEVRLLLIDPKIVELKLYNDIPHLLTPVVTEPKRAFQALQYCICEMERRYTMLDRMGVRDVRSYNRRVREKGVAAERLPYLVVIIDEFADLMATTGKELESTLARLAAMSRAVGIHLVLATQRPSIDVITGLIKANIPSRIAFMVASKFDSRIIIDMVGAEKLLGKGDMLFASAWDPFPIRMQGAYVSEEEVEKAVEYVKTLGEPEYIDDEIFIDEDEDEEPSLFGDEDDDPLFEKALEIVLQQGRASASYIQRRLKIGYNRASRLVELMEEKGIVGPAKGSKPRDLVRNPEVLGRLDSGGRTSQGAAGASARQPSLIPDTAVPRTEHTVGRGQGPGDREAENDA